MSQIKRRTPIHNILLHTLVLFAFLGPSLCGCDGPEPKATAESDFRGRWEGHTVSDDPNERVAVDLTSNSAGDYIFHYGVPHRCGLTGEKVTLEDSRLTLRIKETSGGVCDKLVNGTIFLTLHSDKKNMDARVQHEGVDWDEKATLTKQ